MTSGPQRQFLEAHFDNDLSNGFLNFLFELCDSLVLHNAHQSDLFVLSVFNCVMMMPVLEEVFGC